MSFHSEISCTRCHFFAIFAWLFKLIQPGQIRDDVAPKCWQHQNVQAASHGKINFADSHSSFKTAHPFDEVESRFFRIFRFLNRHGLLCNNSVHFAKCEFSKINIEESKTITTFKHIFIIFTGFGHRFYDFSSSHCGEWSNLINLLSQNCFRLLINIE